VSADPSTKPDPRATDGEDPTNPCWVFGHELPLDDDGTWACIHCGKDAVG
jgi:hypothetical protein